MVGFGVPVDGNRLAGDHFGGWRGKEKAEIGDLLGIDEALDRLAGNIFLLYLLEAGAAQFRFRIDDAVHSFAFDRARTDSVHADIVRAKLDGERLGKADDGPFGRRIGRAQAETDQSGDGGEIDYA